MDEYGRIRQWPRNPARSWHGQLDFEINAMRAAWYVTQLFGPGSRKWKQDDAEFLGWLDEDETWEERNQVTFSIYQWIAEIDELDL